MGIGLSEIMIKYRYLKEMVINGMESVNWDNDKMVYKVPK